MAAMTDRSRLEAYLQHKPECEKGTGELAPHPTSGMFRRRYGFGKILEGREHHCGLQGWNPMIDEPCPACTINHIERDEACTCGLAEALAEAALPPLEQARDEDARIKQLEGELALCYVETGADPDSNSDSILATHALDEVRRLRKDHDAAEDRVRELEATQATPLMRMALVHAREAMTRESSRAEAAEAKVQKLIRTRVRKP